MNQAILDKIEQIRNDHGHDEAVGYYAYVMGKTFASRASSFVRYENGLKLAEKAQGNRVHPGMLRSA